LTDSAADLELLASRDSRYGVESILALFVRQAEKEASLNLCTVDWALGADRREEDGSGSAVIQAWVKVLMVAS
jgi:hypothetical protein